MLRPAGVFLESLQVQNYRGILSGRIDFDDTTLLIGENDCGKSSLLSALAVVLAAGDGRRPTIALHHFHRPVDPSLPLQGPVRIELVFAERPAGEWTTEAMAPLAPLLAPPSAGVRRLVVTVHAEVPKGKGAPETHWRIACPDSGMPVSDDDVDHLAAVRKLCPLVWLKAGMLIGATDVPVGENDDAAVGGRLAALADEVETHYQSLLAGTSVNELAELKAGYEAARELLRQRAEEYQAAGSLSHGAIAEVLGPRSTGRATSLPFHGSAAQQIGVLIVTGAIIRHGLAKWAPGSSPLLVVEDPEAHLHLMTLASVWGLLKHARAQKVIGTQSETLLAAAPLASIRRITRTGGRMRQWRVRPGSLSADELRKLGYHVRARHGEAMFSRCWLMVEGETEFWMLPELARLCGYDLKLEGVTPVEFAQCGLPPLIKLASELGIEWHVLTDGDNTGRDYADEARHFAAGDENHRLTRLRERDVEHCFWRHGYAAVYERAAGMHAPPGGKVRAGRVIRHAIKRHSKPWLAFEVLAAAAEDPSPGVPAPLRRTIETCVQLAREGLVRAEERRAHPPRPHRRKGGRRRR